MFVYTLQQRVLLLIILPMFKLLVLKLVKIIIVFLNMKLLIVSIVLDKEMLKQFFCSGQYEAIGFLHSLKFHFLQYPDFSLFPLVPLKASGTVLNDGIFCC